MHLIPRKGVRYRAGSPDPITPVAEAEVADGGTFTSKLGGPREAVIGDYALHVNGMSLGNRVRSVNMSLAVTEPSSALAGSQPTWAMNSKKAIFGLSRHECGSSGDSFVWEPELDGGAGQHDGGECCGG